MLIFHWLSLSLYVYQLLGMFFPLLHLVYYEWLGVCRSIRPLIVVRLLRLTLKFKLPKARIQQLLKLVKKLYNLINKEASEK